MTKRERIMQLKRIYAWLFTFCLAIYTVYALLDTFVITRVYAAVEQETEAQIATQTEMPGTTAASGKKGRGIRTILYGCMP